MTRGIPGTGLPVRGCLPGVAAAFCPAAGAVSPLAASRHGLEL